MTNKVEIRGASEHNLKCIDVDIPKHKLTLLRGPSGSGKTSLAFDVLYAEARRRLKMLYGDHTLSKEARPKVLSVTGLPPVVAIRTDTAGSRQSTVLSFLGLVSPLLNLINSVGVPECSSCGGAIEFSETSRLVTSLTESKSAGPLLFSIPISKDKGFVEKALSLGLSRSISGDCILDLDSVPVDGTELIIDFIEATELSSQRIYEMLRIARVVNATTLLARQETSDNIRQRRCSLSPSSTWYLVPTCTTCGSPAPLITRKSLLGGEGSVLPRVRLGQKFLHDMYTEELSNLGPLLSALPVSVHRSALLSSVTRACRLGLSHLSLERTFATLSGGERRRLRLSKALTAGAKDLLFVFDEPTAGLHPSDCPALYEEIRNLTAAGNTAVVVEHDPLAQKYADSEIVLGPGGGRIGGTLVSNTPQFTETIRTKRPAIHSTSSLELTGVTQRNLRNLSVSFPLGQMVAVTGVSGSGKTSLVFGALAPCAQSVIENGPTPDASIKGACPFNKVVPLTYSHSSITSRSTVATFVGLSDPLRKLFSSMRLAKTRGYTPKSFSLHDSSGGRCHECAGSGAVRGSTCQRCGGHFFEPAIQEVTFHSVSCGALLGMTADDARVVLKAIPACESTLAAMAECNLGYLTLSQETATLSRGELQRLRLVRDLSRHETETLYLFDEPTSGLDEAEVENLFRLFDKVIANGNSIVAVEHNLTFIKNADYIIDMGPGAGASGGRVVACGTPEQIAKVPASKTGAALGARSYSSAFHEI